MTLTRGRIILASLLLVFVIGYSIYSRAKTVSSVCSGLGEITRSINGHDHPALRDLINSNAVAAHVEAAALARAEGHYAEARLQQAIADHNLELGEAFTDLPPPSC